MNVEAAGCSAHRVVGDGAAAGCKSSFFGERAGGAFGEAAPAAQLLRPCLPGLSEPRTQRTCHQGRCWEQRAAKSHHFWKGPGSSLGKHYQSPPLPPHSHRFPVHRGPWYPACGAGGCTASHPRMLFQGCSCTTEVRPPSPDQPPGGGRGRARLTPRHSYPIAVPTQYLLYLTAAARAAAARSSQGGVKQSKKPRGSGSSNPQLPGKGRGPTKGQTAMWFFLVRSPASPRRPVQFLPTLKAVHKEGNRISCGFPSSC